MINFLNHNLRIKQENIRLKKDLAKYKKLSMIDDLTGLYNRRKLLRDLKYCFAVKKRYKIDYSLIMIDINKFKKINDIYGHDRGDLVIKKVSNVLKNEIREIDKVYRYGGDEFIMIAHCVNTKTISNIIKRIRDKINSKCSISISIGAVKLNKNIEKTIKIADQRMYEDKTSKKKKKQEKQGIRRGSYDKYFGGSAELIMINDFKRIVK